MKRGVLVAVVLGGISGGAQAQQAPPARLPKASSLASVPSARDFQNKGPDTFDLAVLSKDGASVTLYRYDRASRSASVVERLPEPKAAGRTSGFSRLGSLQSRIVLTPEGYKKPVPPQPPGGDQFKWNLPEAELQSALAAVQKLEPEGKVTAIGQLPAAKR
ncbi:MAG: hypothetical protein ABW123_04400 [Cystobacter sp.]